MQPATEVTTRKEREIRRRGDLKYRRLDKANNETKKKFQKNKKKFASLKKFSTFAVPNETGANQRMLRKQIKQD